MAVPVVATLRTFLRDVREAPDLRRRVEVAERVARDHAEREALQADVRAWSLAVDAANRRLEHAPTPETCIAGCWTLGRFDGWLAYATGTTLHLTLADLGSLDCSTWRTWEDGMTCAARTLALAGVEAHPSWARWL